MSLEELINAVALVLMAYLLGGGAQPKPPTIPSCWVSPVQLECWTFAATPAWPGRARTARLGVSKRHSVCKARRRAVPVAAARSAQARAEECTA